ncbi:MAG: molecular chaperone GrpE [Oscillatoriales cyanobacterium C42_A2020_001]|nr:molecular chaperone GrpE [Leptolyngbyaceae cyanobacterium C42_A2020_001]
MLSHPNPELLWLSWVLMVGWILLVLSFAGIRATAKTPSVGEPTIIDLQQQCLRLREELQQQKKSLSENVQLAIFEQLQTLLTNYPSARAMAAAKPDLPAQNLVALFAPLEMLLQSWGITPIGIAWEHVPFQPHLHQPDSNDITEGEWVYIRFVGYQQGDRILCPAKVSRTLPPGIS